MPHDAEAIAVALGGRPVGAYWLCRCPAHDDNDPSLKIIEGEGGRPLLWCYAGCTTAEIIAALRGLGLWPGRGAYRPPDPEELLRREAERARRLARRTRCAKAIWNRSRPAADSPVEAYLRARGCCPDPIPPTIRYHPELRHKETGLRLPAVVAAVARWPSRDVAAVHRTYLTLDGTRKAPVTQSKKALGPCCGGAVRLAPAGRVLALAEGIETALSVQIATGLPTWACLGTSGLETVVLPDPPLAERVVIFADRDENGAGQRAAENAAERLLAQGRAVRIVLPPFVGDFNDSPPPGTAREETAE